MNLGRDEYTSDLELPEPENFFDKRHRDEEIIYKIDPNKQERYKAIQEIYFDIIPNKLLEEAKVGNKFILKKLIGKIYERKKTFKNKRGR